MKSTFVTNFRVEKYNDRIYWNIRQQPIDIVDGGGEGVPYLVPGTHICEL